MDPALLGEHIRDLLDEEASLLSQLEALLDTEAGALATDELPAIERIGAERHECVSALMRIDSERRVVCRMLGIGEERPHFEDLLRRCDPSLGLLALWTAGLEAAARCKDRNDRNGAIVSAKLRRVEAMLVQLRGGTNKAAPVYGATGQRKVEGRGLELGRA